MCVHTVYIDTSVNAAIVAGKLNTVKSYFDINTVEIYTTNVLNLSI